VAEENSLLKGSIIQFRNDYVKRPRKIFVDQETMTDPVQFENVQDKTSFWRPAETLTENSYYESGTIDHSIQTDQEQISVVNSTIWHSTNST
jgi:hypothetical protein